MWKQDINGVEASRFFLNRFMPLTMAIDISEVRKWRRRHLTTIHSKEWLPGSEFLKREEDWGSHWSSVMVQDLSVMKTVPTLEMPRSDSRLHTGDVCPQANYLPSLISGSQVPKLGYCESSMR